MNHQNRQDAHRDIDHIFKDLLPVQGMPERPEQIALSHRMLEVEMRTGREGGGPWNTIPATR